MDAHTLSQKLLQQQQRQLNQQSQSPSQSPTQQPQHAQQQQQQQQSKPRPRASFETDDTQRHLLADSIAPSSSASMIWHGSEDGEATPRPRSPVPYRGFPSEAAYLEALRAFVESRKYTTHDTMIIGFYGQKTSEEICARPAPELGLGLRRKWRERRERRGEEKAAARRTRVGSEVEARGERGSEVGSARSSGSVVGGERRNTVA